MDQDDDQELPERLKNLIEGMKRKRDFADYVDKQLDPHSAKVEKEILMNLWSDLGNHFEYYQCLHAASAFLKALKGMRKVSKMPMEVSLVLQKALVQCAEADLEALQMVKEAKIKYGFEE